MNEDEKKYQAGFNHGFLLAQHEPELASIIINAARTSQSEYAVGLSLGHDEYVNQQEKGKTKEIKPNKSAKTEEQKLAIEKTKQELRKVTKTAPPAKNITPNNGRTK